MGQFGTLFTTTMHPYLFSTTETYIKVKGKWKYLYRAVDFEGNTLDFLLTAKRDAQAAKRFFPKMLKAIHTSTPRAITVDKNPAYPKAIDELKANKELSKKVKLRQKKYLNNLVEQDHRGLKREALRDESFVRKTSRLVKPGMGFGSFNTARRTIKGYEIMNMLRKGQIKNVKQGNVRKRVEFLHQIFRVAA